MPTQTTPARINFQPIPSMASSKEATLLTDLNDYFEADGKGCWIWTRATNKGGGIAERQIDGVKTRVNIRHLVFTVCIADLPSSYRIKTSCGDRRCANPSHLLASGYVANPADRPELQLAAKNPNPKIINFLASLARKIRVAESGCWEWSSTLNQHGYGVVGFRGRMKRVHRVVYELCVGEFDQSLNVCHKCDNPKCCRPDHLFLGTIKDNMDDCLRKGRFVLPPRIMKASTKLTHIQVEEIRQRATTREWGIIQKLASEYGVGKLTISRIVNGRSWNNVPAYLNTFANGEGI